MNKISHLKSLDFFSIKRRRTTDYYFNIYSKQIDHYNERSFFGNRRKARGSFLYHSFDNDHAIIHGFLCRLVETPSVISRKPHSIYNKNFSYPISLYKEYSLEETIGEIADECMNSDYNIDDYVLNGLSCASCIEIYDDPLNNYKKRHKQMPLHLTVL